MIQICRKLWKWWNTPRTYSIDFDSEEDAIKCAEEIARWVPGVKTKIISIEDDSTSQTDGSACREPVCWCHDDTALQPHPYCSHCGCKYGD